jgi:hypothetical protein
MKHSIYGSRRGWVTWSMSRLGVMIAVAVILLMLFTVYRYVSCVNASDSANKAAEDMRFALVSAYSSPVGLESKYSLPAKIENRPYNLTLFGEGKKGLLVNVVGTRCGVSPGGALFNMLLVSYPKNAKNQTEENVTLVIQNTRAGLRIIKKDDCSECISVDDIHYDAGGPHVKDEEDLNDEYVIFRNLCAKTCDLSGWTVKDGMEKRDPYVFSGYVMAASGTTILHSGAGTDSQEHLYWDSRQTPNPAIWNNVGGDTLYLRDANGIICQEYSYIVP